MSYRMIHELRRLMCDKFSILCTLKELNEKQLREEDTMKLNVKIQRLNSEAIIPKYAREGDAGFDLVAVEDTIVEPGATVLVSTGLAFEIPPGYEMQIRPRSGVTVKTKLRVQIGTIDSGYRGEIKVIVDNIAERIHCTGNVFKTIDGGNKTMFSSARYYDENTYLVRKGDRIAQAVIAPFETAHFADAEKLDDSMRGAGGFGSSGVK
jgi:dUTP pyrophosphatase